MKIYDILTNEHHEVVSLLKRLHDAPPKARGAMRTTLLDELTSHSAAEDKVLYTRLAEALVGKDREMVFEAREEHLALTRALEDLALSRVEDERFPAKVKTILDMVEHHVEEEENEMFERAQSVFDDVIAENFAGEYVAQKHEATRTPLVVRFGKARAKQAIADVSAFLHPEAR